MFRRGKTTRIDELPPRHTEFALAFRRFLIFVTPHAYLLSRELASEPLLRSRYEIRPGPTGVRVRDSLFRVDRRRLCTEIERASRRAAGRPDIRSQRTSADAGWHSYRGQR